VFKRVTILVGIKLLSVGHPASLEKARRITTLKYKAEREDLSLFGETKRRLEMRLKEHWDACERGMMENRNMRGRTTTRSTGRRPPY